MEGRKKLMLKKIMSKIVISALLLGIIGGCNSFAEKQVIPDKNLRCAINDELKRDLKTPVSKADVESLKKLIAPGNHIRSMEGLQYAKNLEMLELNENEILDASPIKELPNLQTINLISQTVDFKYDPNNVNPVKSPKGELLPYYVGNGPDQDKLTDEPGQVFSFSRDSFSGVITMVDKVPPQKEYQGMTVVQREGEDVVKFNKKEAKKREESAKSTYKVNKDGSVVVNKPNDKIKTIAIIGAVIIAVLIAIFMVSKNKGKKGKKKTKILK